MVDILVWLLASIGAYALLCWAFGITPWKVKSTAATQESMGGENE